MMKLIWVLLLAAVVALAACETPNDPSGGGKPGKNPQSSQCQDAKKIILNPGEQGTAPGEPEYTWAVSYWTQNCTDGQETPS